MLSTGRIDSLPTDLLDMLRTSDGDLLDFPSLEWILQDDEHGAEDSKDDVPAPNAESGNLPFLHSDNMLLIGEQGQQSSSGGETGQHLGHSAADGTAVATYQSVPATGSYARVSGSGDGVDEDAYDNSSGRHGPPRKKRTRNAEQMQQNRVAQQKYRERKKIEQHQLQNALDQLTAQLAMMKAMEASAMTLKSENAQLATVVNQQAEKINQLTLKVDSQAAELAAAREEVSKANTLGSSQQRMILDQHSRLQLQEEVIDALRGRLLGKMEHAFEGRDPKTVCQRMVAAVRAALEGATNVEGLQESLAKLPEPIITDICRSILCEVKQMWPELAQRLHVFTEGHIGSCGAEAAKLTCLGTH